MVIYQEYIKYYINIRIKIISLYILFIIILLDILLIPFLDL